LGRAKMTKARDREEQVMPLARRDNDCSPERRLIGTSERQAGNSCPLPRPLGRTTPAAGAHREPPPKSNDAIGKHHSAACLAGWRKEKQVISGLMPCERSQGSISGNRTAGNEFSLHSDTLRGSRPNRRANALVPPKASIHSAAVEHVFIPPTYPNCSDFVNNRDKENERICAVVPVSPDCG
jgi:hypothetical protein